MSELKVVARLKIHEGELEPFKTIAQECKKIVKEKDHTYLLMTLVPAKPFYLRYG